jgi:hypothetical protein
MRVTHIPVCRNVNIVYIHIFPKIVCGADEFHDTCGAVVLIRAVWILRLVKEKWWCFEVMMRV